MPFITNLEGNFFYQLKRSVPFSWLTCTGVGDVDMPEGEPDPVYCPDPLNSGKVMIDGFIRGEAGSGTYSLVKPLVSTRNFLLNTKCKLVGRVNWICRANRQDPNNYEVALLMTDSEFRRRGIAAPVSHEPPEARVNTNADLSFIKAMMLHRICIVQQAVDNTANGNSIHFLPARCEDRCGPARDMCEVGIMGLIGPGAYLYESEIKKTEDGGSNWAQTATDPYAYGGDTGPVLQFDSISGVRFVVFRVEAVVGAPAECGVSDDRGVTWGNRFIGNVFGQAVQCVWQRGGDMIVGCNDGYIYISSDVGDTWTVQENGGEGTESINDIVFYGSDVGYTVADNNEMKLTLNGGNDWAALVGPAPAPTMADLTSVTVNDEGHVFVGTDDGRLFRSEDQGASWLDRDGLPGYWLDLGGGSIDVLKREDEANYVMTMIWNDSTPVGHLYRSEDGGATWREIAGMPDNGGINDVHMCDLNHFAMVGNTYLGTTFVAMTTICQ